MDKDGKLFKRGIGSMNKLVINKKNRMFILRAVCDTSLKVLVPDPQWTGPICPDKVSIARLGKRL